MERPHAPKCHPDRLYATMFKKVVAQDVMFRVCVCVCVCPFVFFGCAFRFDWRTSSGTPPMMVGVLGSTSAHLHSHWHAGVIQGHP